MILQAPGCANRARTSIASSAARATRRNAYSSGLRGLSRLLLEKITRRSYIGRKLQRLESPDYVPPEIDLPPPATEPRRVRIRVVVPVPVLPPRAQLQGAEPPDVPAGVDAVRQVGRHMQQAVDHHLKVQRVDQADGPDPEEPFPPEGRPREYGKRDDRNLEPSPYPVPRLIHVRAPAVKVRAGPLIDPPYVRPPEAAVTRARHVLFRICFSVVVAVIRDPPHRLARRIKDGEEYK